MIIILYSHCLDKDERGGQTNSGQYQDLNCFFHYSFPKGKEFILASPCSYQLSSSAASYLAVLLAIWQ